jgi:hypothetical protein
MKINLNFQLMHDIYLIFDVLIYWNQLKNDDELNYYHLNLYHYYVNILIDVINHQD